MTELTLPHLPVLSKSESAVHLPKITALPQEIITYHILQFLDPSDIVNLSICLNLDIPKEVYLRVFPHDPPQDSYNAELFRSRARARLYVCGNNYGDDGPFRMGEPRTFRLRGARVGLFQTISPAWIGLSEGETVQVSSAPTWVQTLTSNGELRFSMLNQKGEVSAGILGSYVAMDAEGRVDDVDDNFEETRDSPELLEWSKKLYDEPFKPTCFVECCSNDAFTLALDDRGLIWIFSRYFGNPYMGEPSVVVENGHLITQPISMLRVGNPWRMCFAKGKGLCVVGRQNHINGQRSGFPSCDGHFMTAEARVVPETAVDIRDYLIVSDMTLILSEKGTVRAVGLYEWDRFCNIEFVNGLNHKGYIVQITAYQDEFALLYEDGLVVVASVKYRQQAFMCRIMTLRRLQSRDISAITLGSGRCYALTKQGEVYRWNFDAGYQGDENETLTMTEEAKKVELPGRAYAICAGAKYHGALIEPEIMPGDISGMR